MGSTTQWQADDGTTVTAWTALPQGPVRGGIVVLQEIFGVNPHIRAVTERFAARGFVAIAPDLFARVAPQLELGYDEAGMNRGRALKAQVEAQHVEATLEDIGRAAQWAQAQHSGIKVAVLGFCWGGLLAWRAAERVSELSASICYYGGGMTTAAELGRRPRCPVMAHFGRQDAWIPVEEVLAFSQAQPQVQLHLYDADHGFNCDQRPSYDEHSAMQARDRTLAFLDQHLRVRA